MSEQAAFREWVVEFLCDQVSAGKMTRDEAAAHITAAAARVAKACGQDPARAERVAKTMISRLPRGAD
jgi:hypothetical protein